MRSKRFPGQNLPTGLGNALVPDDVERYCKKIAYSAGVEAAS